MEPQDGLHEKLALSEKEGRPLIVKLGFDPTVGLDGAEKMSKTGGNCIGLTEAPENMYGKVMSLPDNLTLEYLRLTTNFDAAK